MRQTRAIIADDEEALRSYVKKNLLAAWPGIIICGEAKDGNAALRLIEAERPDIAFLDIRMPGLSGIEVARKAGGQCSIVFITAYDKYAVEAFESEAVDYLLKPVSRERLEKTVKRLRERVGSTMPDMSGILDKLSFALQKSSCHLQWIKAQHGSGIRLIPVAEIYYFKATDKYTTVRIKDGECLIRKTIKELEEELDPDLFWRVHRAAIVNVKAIHNVSRSLAGTCSVKFKDIPDDLLVSRAYSHLFKQM